MTRRGTTLVEILIAFAIATVLLGAATAVLNMLQRMAGAGDLSAAMQQAGLALTAIERDLREAVTPPAVRGEPVVVSRDRVQLIRGELGPDGALVGRLVVYERERGPGDFGWRLRRSSNGSSELLPGWFEAVDVVSLAGAGGPFVRVTLTVSSNPRAPGAAQAVISSLVRVPRPDLVPSELVTAPYAAPLESVRFR